MESWREDHRYPVMDITDGRVGRAGEEHKVKLVVALLAEQPGQVQRRLQGTDRMLDLCHAGLLQFKVSSGREQTSAVLHWRGELRYAQGTDLYSVADY